MIIKLLSTTLKLIIRLFLFYIFILLILKLLYLIDDIFYLVEYSINIIWNFIELNISFPLAGLIFGFILLIYLFLPSDSETLKMKILNLFSIISDTLKSVTKILSAWYYLYDFESLIEVLEGRGKHSINAIKIKVKQLKN